MRILAIGDFHGKFPEKLKNLAREVDVILSTGDYAGIEEWRPLLKKVYNTRKKGNDASISSILGEKSYKDLLKRDYDSGRKVLEKLNKIKVKTFSVFGNGDWYRVFFNDYGKLYEKEIKKMKNIKDINRRRASFQGYKIAGFGGYLDPDIYFSKKIMKMIGDDKKKNAKRRKRYKKEQEAFMNEIKSRPDILLLHYTPYNCLDKLKDKNSYLNNKHVGVSFFNRGIKKYQPVLVICGHMHENQGVCKIGKTTIINTGAALENKAALIEIESKKIKSIRFIK